MWYVVTFFAGVILDEVFGARLLKKFQAVVKQTEANLLAEIKRVKL